LGSIEGSIYAKGEYFGSSLLALDIDGDKLDDLIIGAPSYSDEQNLEIGRIYVYMNSKVRIHFLETKFFFSLN